jgi:hypothetical protein
MKSFQERGKIGPNHLQRAIALLQRCVAPHCDLFHNQPKNRLTQVKTLNGLLNGHINLD